MTSSATQVDKTALGEKNYTVSIWELVSINLWFDVLNLDSRVVLKTFNVDFVVEMTDVANNRVILHLSHVMSHNDVLVSSSSHVNVSSVNDRFNALDLESFHAGLKSADWINFADDDARAASFHGSSAALTDITVAADYDLLTGKHNIGGTHEAIGKRVLASVDVVELLFGD